MLFAKTLPAEKAIFVVCLTWKGQSRHDLHRGQIGYRSWLRLETSKIIVWFISQSSISIRGEMAREDLQPLTQMRSSRGSESELESQSESPGVVATSQESESESIKPPRLRLRIVYYNLTRLGLAKNKFAIKFSEISPFSNFPSQYRQNYEK